jgi:hypothetical protein
MLFIQNRRAEPESPNAGISHFACDSKFRIEIDCGPDLDLKERKAIAKVEPCSLLANPLPGISSL